MEIGLLGVTGIAGRAPVARLADIRRDVVIGSRSEYRAMESYDTILEKWSERSLSIRLADNACTANPEVVIIATPWDAAVATARLVAVYLYRKVVTFMSNATAIEAFTAVLLQPNNWYRTRVAVCLTGIDD